MHNGKEPKPLEEYSPFLGKSQEKPIIVRYVAAKQDNFMKALIEEPAKMSIQSGQHFGPFFDRKTKEALTVAALFREANSQWLGRYFKRPCNKKQLMS